MSWRKVSACGPDLLYIVNRDEIKEDIFNTLAEGPFSVFYKLYFDMSLSY